MTGCSEISSRTILEEHGWNAQKALTAHYNAISSTTNARQSKTTQQQGNNNVVMSVTGVLRKSPSPSPPRPPTPGPSGTQNLPELSQEEEEAELAAARARFWSLIAQNDRQESHRQVSPNADSVGRRPSSQTSLDVIGSKVTRKRIDSAGVTDGASPPKKRREDIQDDEKPYKVRFGPVEVLRQSKPGGARTSRNAPATPTTMDELDYPTKLKLLQDMGLASTATCATIMFECNGNLECAVQKLGGQISAIPSRASIKIHSPERASRRSPRTSIRIQSPPAVPASKPESGPELDSKIAQLQEIFNKPKFILVRALNASNGSVEQAVDLILTGVSASPPPNIPQEDEDLENIDPAGILRTQTPPLPAYEGKGKGRAHVPQDTTPPPTYEGKGRGKAPVRDSLEDSPKTPNIDIDHGARQRSEAQYPSIANRPNHPRWRNIAPATTRPAWAMSEEESREWFTDYDLGRESGNVQQWVQESGRGCDVDMDDGDDEEGGGSDNEICADDWVVGVKLDGEQDVTDKDAEGEVDDGGDVFMFEG